MSSGDEPVVVRWYHQSWAVIGGLVIVASLVAFPLQSPVLLSVLLLIFAGYGLWLYFGILDHTLTSEYPALFELRDWWRRQRRPERLLPDHRGHDGYFLYLQPGTATAGLDVELAEALEAHGELLVAASGGPEALELARRAWLVFVEVSDTTASERLIAQLEAESHLWARTVLLVPPADEPSMRSLRRLDVNLPLEEVPATGLVVAARNDQVPPDPYPLVNVDSGALRPDSLLRARPDLVHGPQAAPGARVVVESKHAKRDHDGAVLASLWLQPTEARLGTVREVVIDGAIVQVRVPEGTCADHQLRLPCQIDGHGQLHDLVLDVEMPVSG